MLAALAFGIVPLRTNASHSSLGNRFAIAEGVGPRYARTRSLRDRTACLAALPRAARAACRDAPPDTAVLRSAASRPRSSRCSLERALAALALRAASRRLGISGVGRIRPTGASLARGSPATRAHAGHYAALYGPAFGRPEHSLPLALAALRASHAGRTASTAQAHHAPCAVACDLDRCSGAPRPGPTRTRSAREVDRGHGALRATVAAMLRYPYRIPRMRCAREAMQLGRTSSSQRTSLVQLRKRSCTGTVHSDRSTLGQWSRGLRECFAFVQQRPSRPLHAA